MQIVLQETVKHLGLVGDVVNVAPGYYRNFLAPRKLALLANPKSIREMEHQKRVVEAKKIAQKDLAVKVKEKLEALQISIPHAAGDGEKLFGSITNKEIVQSLLEAGFDVDRKYLQMPAPIKTIGEHVVELKLHPDVVAQVKISVVRKEKPVEETEKKKSESKK